MKYQTTLDKIPNWVLQTQWVIHSFAEKRYLWYYFIFSQSKYLHLDDTQTLKSLKQRINTSRSIPLFSLFQEHSTITKVTEVIEEIFKVNTNENIEDMNICDFT